MIANKFGAYPTHPGEIIKDEIEYRNIQQRQLADELGMSYSVLNEILNAKRPVSTTSAFLFEAALGISAETLLKLQMWYNMQTAQSDKSFMERLSSIRRFAAML